MSCSTCTPRKFVAPVLTPDTFVLPDHVRTVTRKYVGQTYGHASMSVIFPNGYIGSVCIGMPLTHGGYEVATITDGHVSNVIPCDVEDVPELLAQIAALPTR